MLARGSISPPSKQLPGISFHGSAHGLAQFYDALAAGRLVSQQLLAEVQQLAVAGTGAAGEACRFGLGFQVGTCADAGPLQRANVESKIVNDAVGLVNNAVTAVRGRSMGLARELGVAHCQVVRLRPCAVCVAGVDGGKLRPLVAQLGAMG